MLSEAGYLPLPSDALLRSHLFQRGHALWNKTVAFCPISAHVVRQVGGLNELVNVLSGGKADDTAGVLVEPTANQLPDLVENPGELVDADVADGS